MVSPADSIVTVAYSIESPLTHGTFTSSATDVGAEDEVVEAWTELDDFGAAASADGSSIATGEQVDPTSETTGGTSPGMGQRVRAPGRVLRGE